MREPASVLCGANTASKAHLVAASPQWTQHRGLDGDGARKSCVRERGTTTTATMRSETAGGDGVAEAEASDNYGGGDDNYPRVGEKNDVEKCVEEPGDNRQK